MGRWHELDVPWYETRIVNCAYCGCLIPRRVWLGDLSEDVVFCCEKHEQLWEARDVASASPAGRRR